MAAIPVYPAGARGVGTRLLVDLVLEEGLGLQEAADRLGEETADVYRMRLRRRHKPADRKD